MTANDYYYYYYYEGFYFFFEHENVASWRSATQLQTLNTVVLFHRIDELRAQFLRVFRPYDFVVVHVELVRTAFGIGDGGGRDAYHRVHDQKTPSGRRDATGGGGGGGGGDSHLLYGSVFVGRAGKCTARY